MFSRSHLTVNYIKKMAYWYNYVYLTVWYYFSSHSTSTASKVLSNVLSSFQFWATFIFIHFKNNFFKFHLPISIVAFFVFFYHHGQHSSTYFVHISDFFCYETRLLLFHLLIYWLLFFQLVISSYEDFPYLKGYARHTMDFDFKLT